MKKEKPLKISKKDDLSTKNEEVEEVEQVEEVEEVEQVEKTMTPEPIEKLKKKYKYKIEPEVKKKYNQSYKFRQTIAERLSDKIINNIKETKKEEIKEAPKNNFNEKITPQVLMMPNDDYIKKEKYYKLKDKMNYLYDELTNIKKISNYPKVNNLVYDTLFNKKY